MSKKKVIIVLVIVLLVLVASFLVINGDNFLKKQSTINGGIAQHDFDIVYGDDSALLTIFIYSSYNCSFCRKFFNEAFPILQQEYINSGKVKLVVKPIDFTNDSYALNSLKMSVCINKYGNFEMLHKLLLADSEVIYTKEFADVLNGFVEQDENVAECMLSGDADNYLLINSIDFKRMGLTGTPTFIINNKIFKGYRGYISLKEVIQKELAKSVH